MRLVVKTGLDEAGHDMGAFDRTFATGMARLRPGWPGAPKRPLDPAFAEAERRGYRSLVLSSRITGEAREAALFVLGIGKDMAASGFPLQRPACLIAGGGTTVTLRGKGKGKGKGGRNQEMALAVLAALGRAPKDGEDLVFLSAGTDGNDGPTDATGAIADLERFRRPRSRGLVKSGPTNTDVCDVQVQVLH